MDTSKRLKIAQCVDLKKMNNKTQMDKKTNKKNIGICYKESRDIIS